MSGESSPFFDRLRVRLASIEAVPLLTVLGIVVGLIAGVIIIFFRFVIESIQASFLPGGITENYESLTVMYRIVLPTLGGLAIGLLFHFGHKKSVQVGIIHVMERLSYYQGHLPIKNALFQFIGGAISIICGHSVGREGPSVHLGAAGGSLLGQLLTLPNNSIRTLVACGTAAAIAASFNTPISGVIFAMEVVMMEYTIHGFAPIVISSVSATVLSRSVFGPEPAFTVPTLNIGSMWELPTIIIMGFIIGLLAFSLISCLQFFSRWGERFTFWHKTTIAGFCTGIAALFVPEIMGIGYDTVNAVLIGHTGLGILCLILIVKLLVTTFGLGFGLPGGLIGPTLIIGAAVGGIVGLLVESTLGQGVSSPGFYAIIGMGSMMGATLHAPLAALMAVLELTSNSHIILPGMLAIIGANLVCSDLLKKKSVFLTMMREKGLDYRNDPKTQTLRRIGVASVMNRAFVTSKRLVDRKNALTIIDASPMWIIIEQEKQPKSAMLAADLARFLSIEHDDSTSLDLDLMEIPAQRHDLGSIHLQATLQQAADGLDKNNGDVLYVWRTTAPGINRIYGIITRDMIEASYR